MVKNDSNFCRKLLAFLIFYIIVKTIKLINFIFTFKGDLYYFKFLTIILIAFSQSLSL
jgi:hypothetical protein